jgi:hypothetical protein
MKGKEKYVLILAEILILVLMTYWQKTEWIDKGYADAGRCSSVKLETIAPHTLRSFSFSERIKWYEDRLSPCRQQLKESSARNNIPTILLSAIILNELADIDFLDLGQEWIGVDKGSVGIAQIQIDTAMFHKLVDVRKEEIDRYQNSTAASQRFGGRKPSKNEVLRILIAQKLMQPEIAIEAAAREIKKILENIQACTFRPWKSNFLTGEINLTDGNPNQIYKFVKGETRREKNINLARMIAAPYNSSGIECVENPGNPFSSDDSGPFANPRKRSDSAALIAGDLFDGNLFNN